MEQFGLQQETKINVHVMHLPENSVQVVPSSTDCVVCKHANMTWRHAFHSWYVYGCEDIKQNSPCVERGSNPTVTPKFSSRMGLIDG